MKRILVTGGAGFIGSAVCRHLVAEGRYHVVNVDKLTYSGNLESLKDIENSPAYTFHHADICDERRMAEILRAERIERIMHLAAESHVDRSIDSPAVFLETNVVGTFRLLNAAHAYWRELDGAARQDFRFHHVSTDEVFGDLPFDEGVFTEESPYAPSSPYSASKAASDHFVRAWHETFGLPVVLSNCSNNYGPYHFPEKLVPLIILNALEGKRLPVYGAGANVRDWLFVDDHARALELVMMKGEVGSSYNIGGRAERTNLAVVETICDRLDARRPLQGGGDRRALIDFVADRPGHDRRYAIDPGRIEQELGWSASESFETGIDKTIDWFIANEWWWRPLREKKYAGDRLGSAS
ncbi:dTDP-glucose 4,6-dehydratase [Sphingosinicella rhizophila]|uniref:dTDP-glucose 4,6-dehydratase n=1 Tax=Sphingosinicella rhizophila TaxID=3050082 RepID=A0ABU3Q8G2_9SPHN|nr:dTDP-glucose 4,6-dehydratase [Sphingosinicella sp. GR2756]MDT9599694.1 dTDP-glucose 4,6-dehydratase [Sphingosinicella sp. GR2756]